MTPLELADLSVPGPTRTALTEPFWQAVEEGRLIGQRCGSCGKAVFYPRSICPHCWAKDLAWVTFSGQGRLRSFSVVWKPGHPGWLPAVPYVVGLVALEEGPTMLSQILGSPDAARVGAPVAFAPTKVGSHVLPLFGLG